MFLASGQSDRQFGLVHRPLDCRFSPSFVYMAFYLQWFSSMCSCLSICGSYILHKMLPCVKVSNESRVSGTIERFSFLTCVWFFIFCTSCCVESVTVSTTNDKFLVPRYRVITSCLMQVLCFIYFCFWSENVLFISCMRFRFIVDTCIVDHERKFLNECGMFCCF